MSAKKNSMNTDRAEKGRGNKRDQKRISTESKKARQKEALHCVIPAEEKMS
jgi:hypothetical protein